MARSLTLLLTSLLVVPFLVLASPSAAADNLPPTAAFTATVSKLKATVNAGTSTDTDGTIVSYSWNWGDASSLGSGKTASHSYSTAGVFTITLTVTDDLGDVGVVSHDVKILPLLTVSGLKYDLLPFPSTHAASYTFDLKLVAGSVSDINIRIVQAGTGGGVVSASRYSSGVTSTGTYHLVLFQDQIGAATQVCVAATAKSLAGDVVETPDGSCSGIKSIAGQPVSLS